MKKKIEPDKRLCSTISRAPFIASDAALLFAGRTLYHVVSAKLRKPRPAGLART